MNQFLHRRCFALGPILLVLAHSACSRPIGLHSDHSSQTDRQVPFQASDEKGADSPRNGQLIVQDTGESPAAGLPFRDAQGLPAGTLLTVRLESPVAAHNPGSSETFDAVVDEPVLIEGSTMLPRGAKVAGRVESAQASELKRDRGYVRLTLNSIDVAGQERPIQTSSLFVRGNSPASNSAANRLTDDNPRIVRLEGGRRLTFRLTESVFIASQPEISTR